MGLPSSALGTAETKPSQRQYEFSPRGLQSLGSPWQPSCSSHQPRSPPSSPRQSSYCSPSHSLRQISAFSSQLLLPSLLSLGIFHNSQDPDCSDMTLNGAGRGLENSSWSGSSKNALPSVFRILEQPFQMLLGIPATVHPELPLMSHRN